MNRKLFLLGLLLTGMMKQVVWSKTWHVGATQSYVKPSQVAGLVQNGDTVLIDAGVYSQDATKWTKKNLYIRGLGTASSRTIVKYVGDIPNGKGIFVFETNGQCDNAKIENIVFDGAQVSDANGANGAGIRFQATNLSVINCAFYNCQNGILEGNGSVTTSNITILNSLFVNNGYQKPNDPTFSGYEHNIYIGASTDTLYVSNCCFLAPRGQANSIKTRAQRSYILYNIIDEDTGYGSWELNIAQGGLTVVVGNVIVQGKSGVNHGIVGYDAVTNSLQDFYFVNNTVVNKFKGNIQYFNVVPSSGINTFKVYNNIFSSVSGATNRFCSGNLPSVLDTAHNLFDVDYTTMGFADPEKFNYDIISDQCLAIDAGVSAGSTNTGFDLRPLKSCYFYDVNLIPRKIIKSVIDIGAYEYLNIVGIESLESREMVLSPNPALDRMYIQTNAEIFKIEILDMSGKVLKVQTDSEKEIELEQLQSGMYCCRIYSSKGVFSKLFVKG